MSSLPTPEVSFVNTYVAGTAGRGRGLLVCLFAGLLAGSMLGAAPAQAAARPGTPPLRPQVEKLDDVGGEVRGKPWPQRRQQAASLPAPVWPEAGRARAVLPPAAAGAAGDVAVRAGDLPVWVRRGAGGQRLSAVDVQVIDRAEAPVAWRDGVVLRLSSPARAGRAMVSVDYGAFRFAYGGDWASRLKLWRLPECALVTPGAAGCHAEVLPSRNDEAAGRVSAQVPVAADSAGTVVALAADASGSSGDFTATPLSPSATWSSGGSSGDFSWNYPLRVPPGVGELRPSMALAYSSASVDGRSAATNNQPSWVGEGFEYSPGFIERRYVPCSEDTADKEDVGPANNKDHKTPDLCWRSDNATMSLNGAGSELVFESGKGWHARSEDGAKIEKLTGAGNGDNNGEYWKVTATDGTQYFFGRHSLPGQSGTTDSVNSVRVYGNHDDEPCNATTFAGSHCNQAWRWNLDYVVDVRGNTVSYWYERETNSYAANLTNTNPVSYVRASTLRRIDYGTWDRGDTDRSVSPVAQVVFTVANRCLTDSCATHTATNWPDTPWDQDWKPECETDETVCDKLYAPTFWSTKRLSKITTRVWDTTKATPAWQDVESWTLTHSFPPPGDGSVHAGLWLDSIVHAGHVGGTVQMPPVTFDPVSMPNRVLTVHNTSNNWQRIANIVTESGSKIQVTYSLPECTADDKPAAAHTNTMLCYPVIGPDPYASDGSLITEWWHKYVVRQVSVSDLQLQDGHQAPIKNTFYEYVGNPAWHYADDDGLIKPKYKTWSQFRGFATVKTRVGDYGGPQTLTVSKYLRGMHGDRAAPSGGTRTVTVPASVGSETVYDQDQFAGMLREKTVYNGSEDRPVSKTVNVPWMSAPTASRTINGDTVTARFTDTKITYEATALGVDGARGWRTSRAESTFSGVYGTVEQVSDDGDLAVDGDEKCVTHTYNRNTGKNIVTTVKQSTTTALVCGTPPLRPQEMISDERFFYDGADSVDTAPVYGAVTRTDKLKDWAVVGGTVWQTAGLATFDAFGRQLTATDVKGNTTRTAYTPASGGPVTLVTATSPAPYNWVTSTVVAPYWGATTRTTDMNGRVTDVVYDPLGRVAKVWKVGWSKASYPSSPSVEYSYVFSPTRSDYPYVKTRTMHAGAGYLTSYEIFDGLLRSRQSQTTAVGGGRVVTDTVYDEFGRAVARYGKHAEPGDASGVLWWEPEWSLRAVTRTVYDDADRPVAEILLAGDGATNLVEKWRTSTVYEGDLTRVTPPAGGTATTTLTDAQGRTVELRQHTTAQGAAGPYQATGYTYNRKDQLAKVVDPDGNEWLYMFDLKGRQVAATDPDKGTTRSAYNDFDELVSTTDARGRVLAYQYDQIGRKVGLYEGSLSGTKRAEWKYDRDYLYQTVRGQLTEVTRFEGGQAYKKQMFNFNARYQPAGVDYIIPAAEAGLNGMYSFGYAYSAADGSPMSVTYPAVGELPTEKVTTVYDQTTGLPRGLQSSWFDVANYVTAQDYTPYGEPTVTTRKTAGGLYAQDAIEYDTVTRRVQNTAIGLEYTAGTISDRSYEYDPAGNITSISEAPQVGEADKQCFRYDALRRLTSAWTPQTGIDCATEPSVAGLAGPAAYWMEWTFDAVGNRLGQVSHTTAGDTTQSVSVPAGGPGVVRPHAVRSVTTVAPGQEPVTGAYGYDEAGNTVSRPGPAGGAQTLTWDVEDRVATVVEGTSTVSNVYDADGGRLIRRDATGSTLYLPGMEVRRENGVSTGTRFYEFAGKTVAQRTIAGGLVWLYADHQGTQQISVHAATRQVTIRRQSPYGQPRGTQAGWPNGKGFVGGDTDPTGLTHLGAREYDPVLGRFISVDPIMDLTDPQQWNAYAYADGSPVTSSDPTGLLGSASCASGDPIVTGAACTGGEGSGESADKGMGGTKVTSSTGTTGGGKGKKKSPPPQPKCGPATPEYCHVGGSRQERPYDLLKVWFLDMLKGFHPKNVCGVLAMSRQCARYEYFRWGDQMTKELWLTDEFANIYLEIDRRAVAGQLGGDLDYHYSDMKKSEVYTHLLRDLLSDATHGSLGSSEFIAVTGSFDVDWKVVGYENENPVVEYHVQNATTIYSGTRIPGVTPPRGDGSAGSGADAYPFEHYMIQSYRFRATSCVDPLCVSSVW